MFTFGTFLMVADELISLALYGGVNPKYPYPLIGTLDIWSAWVIDYSVILVSELTAIISFYKAMKAK